jgi:hypothetical protein
MSGIAAGWTAGSRSSRPSWRRRRSVFALAALALLAGFAAQPDARAGTAAEAEAAAPTGGGTGSPAPAPAPSKSEVKVEAAPGGDDNGKLFRPPVTVGNFKFLFGGDIEAGGRTISADRATGNEASAHYLGDLWGEVRFGEELGARLRVIFRNPVSKRARSHELYETLNEPFELRELYVDYRHPQWGDFQFGKFRLPFGPRDVFEHEAWNQPLLEYQIAHTGAYDVGGLWGRDWFGGHLESRFAVIGGNSGALDTNSAVGGAGSLTGDFGWFRLGAWGKYNRMDTTPIKRADNAIGCFLEMEYRHWRLTGKHAWLRQGFERDNFPESELRELGYDSDEIDVLVWRRDNGKEKRTLRGWYLLLNAPTIRNVNFFGSVIDRIDIFAHVGQLHDPNDSVEHLRDRAGVGASAVLVDTKRARLSVSAGGTFDDETSNTRPYLDRLEDIDERNSRFTAWLKVTLSF